MGSTKQDGLTAWLKMNVGTVITIASIIIGLLVNHVAQQSFLMSEVNQVKTTQEQKWIDHKDHHAERARLIDSENARQNEVLKSLQEKTEAIANLQYRITTAETLMKEMNGKVDKLSEDFSKASLSMGNVLAAMTEQIKGVSTQIEAMNRNTTRDRR